MSKMKKTIVSLILFLIVLLTGSQVMALSAGNHGVTLTHGGWGNYPWYITADGEEIFCNQHGASLRNNTYSFSEIASWTSTNDVMGYIFSTYKDSYPVHNFDYDTVQRVVWNISTLDSQIKATVGDFEGFEDGTDDWEEQEKLDDGQKWTQKVTAISSTSTNSKDSNALSDATKYLALCKYVEKHSGYRCVLNQITNDPVAVNTDEETYIIGKFSIDYLKTIASTGEMLSGLTDIRVIDVDTGEEIHDALIQRDKDGAIFQLESGEFPESGEEFNVIVPYNETRHTERIKVIADYKYLANAWAEVSSWALNGKREYSETTYDADGRKHVNYYDANISAWQKQLSIGRTGRDWGEGHAELVAEVTPWTFEIQKTASDTGDPLRATFLVNFYDQDTGKQLKSTSVSTTNEGIAEITGLQLYGNLKVTVQETATEDGYQLDDHIREITFTRTKDLRTEDTEGVTVGFENVNYDRDDFTHVSRTNGVRMTASIENEPVDTFDIDIIKVDKNDDSRLSGAKFTVTLEKEETKHPGEYTVAYYGTNLSSPSISINESKIDSYRGEKGYEPLTTLKGNYRLTVKETTNPSGYKTNLKNKDIVTEFKVTNNSGKIKLMSDPKINDKDTDYAEVDINKNNNKLTLYVKNEPTSGGGGGGSSKHYNVYLNKIVNNTSTGKTYPGPEIEFEITLYQINGSSLKKLSGPTTHKTKADGSISLGSLKYTGDILIKMEETVPTGLFAVGSETKYIRYNATKSGKYYYINSWEYANEDGSRVSDEAGVSAKIDSSSSIPSLTMEVENDTPGIPIPLTMDIGGVVFLDEATGKATERDNLYSGTDSRMAGIETTLYYADGTKVEMTGNPTRTNSAGEYSFTGLDAMKKYIVKFTYNGQDYINVDKMPDYEYETAQKQGYDAVTDNPWYAYSKAAETDREALNARFANINAASSEHMSYTGINGDNIAYPEDTMNAVYDEILAYLTAEGKAEWSVDEVAQYLEPDNAEARNLKKQQLQYVKDCEIEAYTDQYPAMDKFNISDDSKELYTVDMSTKTTKHPAETYPALYEGQNQINFGVKERPNIDLELLEDVQDIRIEINKKSNVITYGKYSTNKFGVHDTDLAYDPQEIVPADYLADDARNLGVYVKFKIKVDNTGDAFAKVSQLINHYDSDYYEYPGNTYTYYDENNRQQIANSVYFGDANGNEIKAITDVKTDGLPTTTIKSKNISEKNEDRDNVTFKQLLITLPEEDSKTLTTGGDTEYVYLVLKLTNGTSTSDALKAYFADKKEGQTGEWLANFTEVYSYTTDCVPADHDQNLNKGLVDRDSIAGNYVPGGANEDDNWAAPNLVYKIKDQRTLSGNVFEQTGIEDASEVTAPAEKGSNPGIANVKVELVELVEDDSGNNITETKAKLYHMDGSITDAETRTDSNGDYEFKDYIPGNYVVKFTYGDKTQLIDGTDKADGNSKYNGQDYQSVMANPDTDNNKYWYVDNADTRYSDAYDEVQARQKAIDYVMTESMSGSGSMSINYAKSEVLKGHDLENLEKLAEKQVMTAYTSTLELEVDKATKVRDNTEKNPTEYYIGNVDFGLVKRAPSKLKVEKNITNIKITQEDGSLLLDSKVHVSDDRKTITLETNSDKVHFQSIPPTNPYGNGEEAVARLEIDDQIIRSTIEITYEITVTDESPKTYLRYFKDGAEEEIAIAYYKEDAKDLVYYEEKDPHNNEQNAILYHDLLTSYKKVDDSKTETNLVLNKVDNMIDYVSNNLGFDDAQNKGLWQTVTESDGFTDSSKGKDILITNVDKFNEYTQKVKATNTNPLLEWLTPTATATGEERTRSAEIILTKQQSQDIDFVYYNEAEIIQMNNSGGRVEDKIVPGDVTTKDTTSQYVVITDPTGETHYYYALVGGLLAVFAAGVVGIKKFVVDKKVK